MERVYVAKCLIKHNGRRYAEGKEIQLDESSAKILMELKVVQPTKKTIHKAKIHKNPPAGDGTVPSPPQEFIEMTNAQQIEYLSTLSDDEFKARYEGLLQGSKSKSKAYIEQRLKQLNSDIETQE